MFASLRNNFSNYRTCSLRFDIEENIIIEAFASLRFDNLDIAPGGVCHRGLSCIWACLHYRGMCLIHRDQCNECILTVDSPYH